MAVTKLLLSTYLTAYQKGNLMKLCLLQSKRCVVLCSKSKDNSLQILDHVLSLDHPVSLPSEHNLDHHFIKHREYYCCDLS